MGFEAVEFGFEVFDVAFFALTEGALAVVWEKGGLANGRFFVGWLEESRREKGRKALRCSVLGFSSALRGR